jgi:hypothetical protein
VLESSLKIHKRHFEPSNSVSSDSSGPFVNAKRTRKGAPELPAFEIEHFDHSNPTKWQDLMHVVKMQSPDDRPHQGMQAPSASETASLFTPEWSVLLQAHAQAEAHAQARAHAPATTASVPTSSTAIGQREAWAGFLAQGHLQGPA